MASKAKRMRLSNLSQNDESMIRNFLGIKQSKEAARKTHAPLFKVASKNKSQDPPTIPFMVDYLVEKSRILPSNIMNVAEFLSKSCTYTPHPTLNSIAVSSNEALVKQRQLLQGIERLLTEVIEKREAEKNFAAIQKEVSLFFWAASIGIWHNAGAEATKQDTVAVCLEYGQIIISKLTSLISKPCEKNIFQASSWLLCSLGRISPTLLNLTFEFLGLSDKNASEFSTNTLDAIGLICQSQNGAKYLIRKKLFEQLSQIVVEICSSTSDNRIGQLYSVIECLSQLSSIDIVVQHLDTNETGEIIKQLIELIVKSVSSNSFQTSDLSTDDLTLKLVDSTITFIRKLLAVGGGHRERIASIISDVIDKTGSMNEITEKLFLKLILADESIPVRLVGVVQRNLESHTWEDRLIHPLFGCNQDDLIKEVPISTLCSEFMPALRETKPIKGSSGFNQFAVQLVCGAFAFNNALNNKWSLANVIEGLRSLKRFSHGLDEMSLSEKNDHIPCGSEKMDVDVPRTSKRLSSARSASSSKPSTSCVKSNPKKAKKSEHGNESDLNDGYFMLNLCIKVCVTNELLENVEDDFSFAESLRNLRSQPSTFFKFAESGGLKALSNAADVIDRVDKKLKNVDQLMKRNNNFELKLSDILEDAFNQNKHCADSDMIAVALSVFLLIDSYGPTFVNYHEPSARKLIYIMLNINLPTPTKISAEYLPILPDQGSQEETALVPKKKTSKTFAGFNLTVPGPAPVKTQTEVMSKLALVPFFALSKCFEQAYPPNGTLQNAEDVRSQAMEEGTVDVLLTLLAYYSHQKPQIKPLRINGDLPVTELLDRLISFSGNEPDSSMLVQQFKNSHQNPKPTLAVSLFGDFDPSNSTGWAKGTGYGSGTTDIQSTSGSNTSKQRKKQHEITVTCLLNVFTNIIKPLPISSTERLRLYVENQFSGSFGMSTESPENGLGFMVDEIPVLNAYSYEFIELLERSCLIKTICSFMLNDSVLDISAHVVLYDAVIGFLWAVCESPKMRTFDGVETLNLTYLLLTSTEAQNNGIHKGLKRIADVTDSYMDRITKNKGKPPKSTNTEEEETLFKFLIAAKRALNAVEKVLETRRKFLGKNMDTVERPSTSEMEIKCPAALTIPHIYEDTLRTLQFTSIPFYKADGKTLEISYHYQSELSKGNFVNATRTKRLAQEVVSITNSLPMSYTSAVFVRAADERLDMLKVLITGPDETPYAGGCYEFDVFFPTEYPSSPMKVNLMTTGNRSVRFNPNLYADGKVCLSILNTWSGSASERWNSETSSFLQVLVSIQSLILVNEPYYNEPGYEKSRGTASGDDRSREYTANIRHQSVRWAMTEQLRHPPKAFEEVVRKHFWIRRNDICMICQKWINEMKEWINEKASPNMTQHLSTLEKNYETLLTELSKLACPDPSLANVPSPIIEDYLAKQ